MQHESSTCACLPLTDICYSIVARCRAPAVNNTVRASLPCSESCVPITHYPTKDQFMNLASSSIGAMKRKQTFVGIVLLSLVFFPCAAMAELNDGSLSSPGQSAPVHRETSTESDQRFRAAFHAAPLSLAQAIGIAERLHAGSRTSAISFDISHNPSYRVRTVKDKEIWENAIDVLTGRTGAPEIAGSLNELEIEDRDNINALKLVHQELSDAVAIAEKVQLERPSAEAWSRRVISLIS
jgi:hypothetical protein